MNSMKLVLVLFSLAHLGTLCTGLIERLYCGKDNCYDLLDLTRDASQAEIRKAYRKKAIQYHPDKNKKKGSREIFEQITTAYEVLKDEEERHNYDYMLDHPEEVYSHYYRYYRRRTPKVDVRLVLGGGILVISVLQYLGWWHSYQTAVNAALKMPKYRTRAKEIAVSRGLIAGEGGRRRRGKEGKAEEEAILKTIIEENLNITGGYSKPRLLDVLVFRILFSPYTLVLYLWWYLRWVWLFNIRREPYGAEEKEYMTHKTLKLSSTYWEAFENEKKEELVARELWIGENLAEWKKEQQEEQKVKLAESSKYKAYRRYMKNHGKTRPTLE